MFLNVILHSLDLPPLYPAAIHWHRLLIFSLAKLSPPGSAQFSSINVRIEVSEFTTGFHFPDYKI
jgi:hypothetical protein